MIPSHIKALILDMDGVIWKSDEPIGDLPAIFKRVEARGLKYVFATNNGTKTPRQYADKLAEFGLIVQPWQVVTSSLAVSHMLAQKFPSGTKIFVIGEDGVNQALQDNGFQVLELENAPDAQAVVMGIDRAITFDKMREATLLVRRGVPFYGTNPDKTFPTPRGEIPGAGAWISVVKTATDIEPIYAGKPFPYMMELSLELLGTKKEETLVVGDRLETDIASGRAVGCPTALVLSGVATREQAKAWKPSPDLVVRDLAELVELML
ncbi:MAG TPA: HAD-IIA family hydrolase [Anaerolineales bacterium]|nr:HAD-IIA family hydrolase [Anaerolineales bacterium]